MKDKMRTIGLGIITALTPLALGCGNHIPAEYRAKQETVVDGRTLQVGDQETVLEWDWVYPNEELSDSRDYDAINKCGIETGGILEVLGVNNFGEVLVEYDSPSFLTGGTQCPDGITYTMKAEDFAALNGI